LEPAQEWALRLPSGSPEEGFQAVLSAPNATKTRELADRLKAKGYQTEVRSADCSGPSSVASLIANVEKQFGPIEVLHYNVASMRKATPAEQPRDTLISDLAVNTGGALAAAQAVTLKMSERRSGTIVRALTLGLLRASGKRASTSPRLPLRPSFLLDQRTPKQSSTISGTSTVSQTTHGVRK
jgi:NAD(P)-dependent dehydrogenase (short-subunit alcohol dehydrogenase family)